jgi:UDP-N-acetylmuramoylalanine--D-glutamate ligase
VRVHVAAGPEGPWRARGFELVDDPATAAVVVVDEWTPEIAPVVVEARRRDARVTCLAQLVVDEARAPIVGITGTAGKTTTAWTLAGLLPGAAVARGRAENAWPDETLLGATGSPLLLELTSTHLCYLDVAPCVAVVTCFWPDHVELHGSAEAYAAAKARLLERQQEGDWAVLNADDPGSRRFDDVGRARRAWFSGERAVDGGVGVAGGRLVARLGGERDLGSAPTDPPRRAAATAAACAALLLGERPMAVVVPDLPHRQRVVGTIDGVTYVDDGMAATPAKALAALARFPGAIVLLGGADPGVHASAEENAALATACAQVGRAVLFGEAAERLHALLPAAPRVASLDAAIAAARTRAAVGDVILLAPMFPLTMDERARFARMGAG